LRIEDNKAPLLSRASLSLFCSCPGKVTAQFNVAKLIEQHGADAKLTDLLHALADNCPKARSVSVHDRCKAVYEGLDV
jgi:hypothetical protein